MIHPAASLAIRLAGTGDLTAIAVAVAAPAYLLWRVVRPPAAVPPVADDADAEPCEHCGYDVRGGLLVCPECGNATRLQRRQRLRRLRDWPATPVAVRRPSSDEQSVVIFATDNVLLVRALQQQLIARGIQARSRGRAGGIDPVTATDRAHWHELLVWSADADLATAMVAALWPAP